MSDGSTSTPVLNARTDGMLISEQIADAPTQRFYATSLFVLLQALKFYDYIQLYGAPPSAETIFAIKWIGIDAAYLLLIPKLKIPWLSFKLTTSILQIIAIGLLNVVLSARIPISIPTIGAALLRLVYDRELSVLEHNVKVSDIINNSSRILGKHTVNILPESTARFNPAGACYCIPRDGDSAVSIPLRLNSTIPMLVQYSRINPESNDVVWYNISGKSLKSLIKRSDNSHKVWDMPLAVSEPGLYRIERVQDSSRLDVRLYRTQALVVNCPSASLVIPERLTKNPDRCTGEMDELSIRTFGLPPLKVKYNRWIEGRERISTIDSVKPEDYISPLMVGHTKQSKDISTQQVLSLATVQDVLWAKSRQVDVHLNSSLATAGTWSYTIEEVEDACGNVINYSKMPKNTRQSISQGRLDLTRGDDQSPVIIEAPSYEFHVHERPRISFRGCNPEAPTKLLPGKQTKLFFNLNSPESVPVQVQLGIEEPDALTSKSNGSKFYQDVTIKSKNHGVLINTPGIYTIAGFSSKYCKGIVEMPSKCIVHTPAQPSLTVAFEPIQDKCAGSIGLLVDLSFTGTPPFSVAWKVSRDGRAMVHRKKIDRARHQLRFTPDEAGHFKYEFLSVDDINYQNVELVGDSFSVEQTVYPLAGAVFVQRDMKRCCIDDAVSIPVRLVGSGPWDLVYEIEHGGRKQRFELNKLKDPSQFLKTPHLTKGGTHTVTLVSIQDANGCKTPLEEMDTTIEVRRERPSAAFYTIDDARTITIVEGSAIELPLRLTGDGPWTVSYLSPDGNQVLRTNDRNAKLKVNVPGTYTLQEILDAYCPGSIDSRTDKFSIHWFPRPQLSIPPSSANLSSPQKYVRREVCEGDEDTFDVEIFGAAPFSISYDRVHLAHKGIQHDKQTVDLNAAQPLVSIKSKTTPAGTWKYTFHGVADARYDLAPRTNAQRLEIEQFVHSRPVASFIDKEKTYNYCLEVDLAQQEADRIPVKLQGEAPFSARFRVKHELTGTTEYLTDVDIPSHKWGLQIPKSMLTLGKHIVSIAEVVDANGCSRTYAEKDGHIYVAISERPSILPVSSRTEFCVGDRLSYALQGTPPFKIEYQFNGAQKRATVSGPVFSRVAEQPGEFSVLSLYDSASKCKVSVSGLDKVVHDIPSVRVSEGKNIIESIHEGDQAEIIFHLFGTPPFALTYTRSESDKGRHNKVLETHSVSGIWDDKYIIHSSVAGTFAATEVHDAHCRISLQN